MAKIAPATTAAPEEWGRLEGFGVGQASGRGMRLLAQNNLLMRNLAQLKKPPQELREHEQENGDAIVHLPATNALAAQTSQTISNLDGAADLEPDRSKRRKIEEDHIVSTWQTGATVLVADVPSRPSSPSETDDEKDEEVVEGPAVTKIPQNVESSPSLPPATTAAAERPSTSLQKETSTTQPATDSSTAKKPSKPKPTSSRTSTTSAPSSAHLLRLQKTKPATPSDTVSGPAFYSERTGDPVFTFGNYETYYNYRTFDERVSRIAFELDKNFSFTLEGKNVLDIGCNSGNVTAGFAEYSKTGRVVGCDIDETLIAKACCKWLLHGDGGRRQGGQEDLHTAQSDWMYGSTPASWSTTTCSSSSYSNLFFDVANFATEKGQIRFCKEKGLQILKDQLHYTRERPADVRIKDTQEVRLATPPHGKHQNHDAVVRECAPSPPGPEGVYSGQQFVSFDVIVAFSITKWVHYQYGDAGIQRFFDQIYENLKPGGYFILEPQPWSSYKKKQHLTADIKQRVAEVKIHPGSFTRYLSGTMEVGLCESKINGAGAYGGFELKKQISGKELPGFDRDVFIYQKLGGTK
ncbi:unnamed protein product [Amoebophrya sp. A120]|nr:unnamed protein product [Amoebophrya sp. A120]|eukprot:GSA120T00017210001.1